MKFKHRLNILKSKRKNNNCTTKEQSEQTNEKENFFTYLNNNSTYTKLELPKDNGIYIQNIQSLFDALDNEIKNKNNYQKKSSTGIIIFLCVQLLFSFYIIIQLFHMIKDSRWITSEYYFNAMNNYMDFIKIYLGGTLFEFVLVFCYIVKWAFKSTISDLLNSILNNNKNSDDD